MFHADRGQTGGSYNTASSVSTSCNMQDIPKGRRGRTTTPEEMGMGTFHPPPPPQTMYSATPRGERMNSSGAHRVNHTHGTKGRDGSGDGFSDSGNHDGSGSDGVSDRTLTGRSGRMDAVYCDGHRQGGTPGTVGSDNGDVFGTKTREEEEHNRHEQGHGRVAQIAEGLMWVQKHPVLAAVIWMVGKVLAPGEEAGEGAPSGGDGKSGDSVQSLSGCEILGKGAAAQDRRYDGGGSPASGNGRYEQRPGLLRGQSKGSRLSWSDDHGGSLAEYYEDERARFASDASSTHHEAPSSFTCHRSQSTPCKLGGTDMCDEDMPQSSQQGGHDYSRWQMQYANGVFNYPDPQGQDQAERRRHGQSSPSDDSIESFGSGGDGSASSPRGVEHAGCSGEQRELTEDDLHGVGNLGLRVVTMSKNGGSPGIGDKFAEGSNARSWRRSKGMTDGGGRKEDPCPKVNGSTGSLSALHHSDTFYGNMTEAMRDQKNASLVDCDIQERSPQCRSFSDSDAYPKAPIAGQGFDDVGSFLPRTSATLNTDADDGGGGAPHGVGPGTWSPQWGWYVNMTPPQDMYPTAQHTQGAAKAATPSSASDDLAGRPPRP